MWNSLHPYVSDATWTPARERSNRLHVIATFRPDIVFTSPQPCIEVAPAHCRSRELPFPTRRFRHVGKRLPTTQDRMQGGAIRMFATRG